jgi:D-alanine-D-alanine ligase
MKVAIAHNRDLTGVINVFGPQNRERYNPKTIERVALALENGGHTVRVIDGNMQVIDQLRDFMPRVVAGERPGMVFNMAYGIQGVSRYTHLPAMLEMLGVPYVGSNPLAHGLALDKVIAKMVFSNAGLPTPPFWNFASPDDRFDDLAFPVIVKPKMEAVSYGVRVVDNEHDLREAVEHLIKEFQQHVLVEKFIRHRSSGQRRS